jgi:hypothetical protein
METSNDDSEIETRSATPDWRLSRHVLTSTHRFLPDLWNGIIGGLSVGFVIWVVVAVIRSSRSGKDVDGD